jgi:putrescine transport system ATP-binding protein
MRLKVSDLSKRFGNNWVLRDVDLDIETGSVSCICGGVSAGKTTLLKLLSGAETPNSGVIEGFRNGDVLYLNGGRGKLGFIFGKAGGTLSGATACDAIQKAVKTPHPIVMVDEPFAGMDIETRSRVADMLRSAASDGKAVIFTTADFQHACEAADRVSILDGGTIVQAGTAKEIYDAPNSASVARLSGRINLFEARRLTSSNAAVPEFHVVDGGHRIFAQPVHRLRLGAINRNIQLGIRPEDIVISMNASFPEDNVLRGKVKSIRFDGGSSLVDFDAGGLELTARVFRVVGLKAGDECMLGLPVDRVMIFS